MNAFSESINELKRHCQALQTEMNSRLDKTNNAQLNEIMLDIVSDINKILNEKSFGFDFETFNVLVEFVAIYLDKALVYDSEETQYILDAADDWLKAVDIKINESSQRKSKEPPKQPSKHAITENDIKLIKEVCERISKSLDYDPSKEQLAGFCDEIKKVVESLQSNGKGFDSLLKQVAGYRNNCITARDNEGPILTLFTLIVEIQAWVENTAKELSSNKNSKGNRASVVNDLSKSTLFLEMLFGEGYKKHWIQSVKVSKNNNVRHELIAFNSNSNYMPFEMIDRAVELYDYLIAKSEFRFSISTIDKFTVQIDIDQSLYDNLQNEPKYQIWLNAIKNSSSIQDVFKANPGLINKIDTVTNFTPLTRAAQKGDLNTVKCLIELKADHRVGKSALFVALQFRQYHVADYLFNHLHWSFSNELSVEKTLRLILIEKKSSLSFSNLLYFKNSHTMLRGNANPLDYLKYLAQYNPESLYIKSQFNPSSVPQMAKEIFPWLLYHNVSYTNEPSYVAMCLEYADFNSILSENGDGESVTTLFARPERFSRMISKRDLALRLLDKFCYQHVPAYGEYQGANALFILTRSEEGIELLTSFVESIPVGLRERKFGSLHNDRCGAGPFYNQSAADHLRVTAAGMKLFNLLNEHKQMVQQPNKAALPSHASATLRGYEYRPPSFFYDEYGGVPLQTSQPSVQYRPPSQTSSFQEPLIEEKIPECHVTVESDLGEALGVMNITFVKRY